MELADLMDAFPGRFVSELLAEEVRLQGAQYPDGFLRDVLEAKSYRVAKRMVEDADTPEKAKSLPKSPYIGLVLQVKAALSEEDDEDDGEEGDD